MYKILIDSSDRYEKTIRLFQNEKELEVIMGDVDIVDSIKTILEKHHLKPADISGFVPNKGPGSFTGLKIGVAITNAFNWALGRKNISNLDYPEYGREPNITLPL